VSAFSAFQVASSSLPVGRLRAFWKPDSAWRMLEPKAPSISPGEKWARSSSTWARSRRSNSARLRGICAGLGRRPGGTAACAAAVRRRAGPWAGARGRRRQHGDEEGSDGRGKISFLHLQYCLWKPQRSAAPTGVCAGTNPASPGAAVQSPHDHVDHHPPARRLVLRAAPPKRRCCMPPSGPASTCPAPAATAPAAPASAGLLAAACATSSNGPACRSTKSARATSCPASPCRRKTSWSNSAWRNGD
jgi:hypothetical protein